MRKRYRNPGGWLVVSFKDLGCGIVSYPWKGDHHNVVVLYPKSYFLVAICIARGTFSEVNWAEAYAIRICRSSFI